MAEANRLPDMSTDFGKRIKQARKHAKLTQVALAEKIQLAQASLSHLENSGFASAHTVQIAAACEVNPRWLATGEGEMELAPREALNVTTLPAPALRGLAGVLSELQAVMDGLSPLLQVAAKAVMHQWIDGQASLPDVVATIEGMQQISVGSAPATEKRAA